MTKLTFNMFYRPPKTGDGHKLFTGSDNRVYVADWSGVTPGETDDGPLYVVQDRPVVACLGMGGLFYNVPVFSDRMGSHFNVWMTQGTFDVLRKHLDLKLEVAPELRDFLGTAASMRVLNTPYDTLVNSPRFQEMTVAEAIAELRLNGAAY